MKTIKRAIHLDFHNMPGIHDFGVSWDAKTFAAVLSDSGVKYINAFAKCNLGFAYYPTEIGIVYPGLKHDIFGEMLKECHRKGIGVTAYVNVGLDHEQARLHRDWCVQNKEGQVLSGDRTGNIFRNMCYKTGYRKHILGVIKEIMDKYDADGLFCDCMWLNVCYGNECLEAVKEQGHDPLNETDVIEHSKEARLEMCREIKKIVGSEKYLYLNNLPERDVNDLNTHIEIECLPSGAYWGYDFFLPQISYLRNLQKKVVYMTGRFQTEWGDFGGFKGKASLQNDMWDAVSNGAEVSIGDHMHPTGKLQQGIYSVIKDIFQEAENLEAFTEGALYMADIGVLGISVSSEGMLTDTYKGLARMLAELKHSFNIVTGDMDISPYKVLILPENIEIAPLLKKKIEKHLLQGKGILSTGTGGLNASRTGFALKQWRFLYGGEMPCDTSYFRINKGVDSGIEDIYWSMYSHGILIKKTKDTETIADYIKPYFEKHWDGFHGYFYTPPEEKETEYAAAVRADNVFHICFDIFEAYYISAMRSLKLLVKHCLDRLLHEPLIKCKGIPSTARVTLTGKNDLVLLHVKATFPEARGKMKIIEEHQSLAAGAVVGVLGRYCNVYSAMNGKPLKYEIEGAYTNVILPRIEGYIMVVLEKESQRIR